jgi:hypothetical protein
MSTPSCSPPHTTFNPTTLKCECPPGFVGKSDFVGGEPTCDYSIVALQIIWGFVCILHAGGLIYSTKVFIQRVQLLLESNSHKKLSWKVRTILTSRLAALGIVSIVFHLSFSLLGLFHALDVTETLGHDTRVTVLWAIGTIFFWAWTCLQTMNFLFVSTAQARMNFSHSSYANAWTQLKVTATLMMIGACIASAGPLAMLDSESRTSTSSEVSTYFYNLSCVHYGATIGCLVLALSFLFTGIAPVAKEIEHALKTLPGGSTLDAPLKTAVYNIHRVLQEGKRASALQAFLCILFCIPIINLYSGYFQATSWLTAFPTTLFGTYVISPNRKRGTTSGGGGGRSNLSHDGNGGAISPTPGSVTNSSSSPTHGGNTGTTGTSYGTTHKQLTSHGSTTKSGFNV